MDRSLFAALVVFAALLLPVGNYWLKRIYLPKRRRRMEVRRLVKVINERTKDMQ